jgi:hypothetical protein
MVIDPKHIQESEQLFIKGNTFDPERLDVLIRVNDDFDGSVEYDR